MTRFYLGIPEPSWLPRMHVPALVSAVDSMAWSYHARNHPPCLPGHAHGHGGNCLEYAHQWYGSRIGEAT